VSRRNPDQRLRWHRVPDADRLAQAAASAVIQAAETALQDRGGFEIVLAGGGTPRALYRRLCASGVGDAGWHVWFGDERSLPAGDPDRNETLARSTWLDGSRIPATQIHPVAADVEPADAARRYAGALAGHGPFDLVLLGLGEDGHTASLFPGQPTGLAPDAPDAIPVRDAPKPPADRISLSARRLSAARQVIVLVAGAGKRDAVRRWRAGEDLPIAHIRPAAGVDVYIDEAASGGD
jgi:6-phosphogluconolactonase